jgi:protein-arginine deiminase
MRLTSLYPGGINTIVLSAEHVIVPRSWGPVVDGVDIFGEAVRRAYRTGGLAPGAERGGRERDVMVHEVDTFELHHINGGEVHCGTNTLRETSEVWWNKSTCPSVPQQTQPTCIAK